MLLWGFHPRRVTIRLLLTTFISLNSKPFVLLNNILYLFFWNKSSAGSIINNNVCFDGVQFHKMLCLARTMISSQFAPCSYYPVWIWNEDIGKAKSSRQVIGSRYTCLSTCILFIFQCAIRVRVRCTKTTLLCIYYSTYFALYNFRKVWNIYSSVTVVCKFSFTIVLQLRVKVLHGDGALCDSYQSFAA